jgi:hypothetical protein
MTQHLNTFVTNVDKIHNARIYNTHLETCLAQLIVRALAGCLLDKAEHLVQHLLGQPTAGIAPVDVVRDVDEKLKCVHNNHQTERKKKARRIHKNQL